MPKILIVRACAIGDFVLNLPALVALQNLDPDVQFTLLGNQSYLQLAREFVSVDRIYSIEVQPWSRLFYEPLPGLEFDSALVWMKDETVAANLLRSGITRVIRADPFPRFGHAADHLMRTLALSRPALPDLWSPTSSDVVIHPSSGSPRKNWPFFEELMRRLPESHLLPQNLSLLEVAQYLRTVRAFIGNDSGVMHIAAYLGCPTVALFGPTDPRTWGPIGRRSRIIWKSRLEHISVNDVLMAIRGQTSDSELPNGAEA